MMSATLVSCLCTVESLNPNSFTPLTFSDYIFLSSWQQPMWKAGAGISPLMSLCRRFPPVIPIELSVTSVNELVCNHCNKRGETRGKHRLGAVQMLPDNKRVWGWGRVGWRSRLVAQTDLLNKSVDIYSKRRVVFDNLKVSERLPIHRWDWRSPVERIHIWHGLLCEGRPCFSPGPSAGPF